MWKMFMLAVVIAQASIEARYLDTGPDDPQTIPCAWCAGERCAGVQVCHYGVFANEMCGGHLDCYKAPGESCGETVRQILGRCRPGLACRCGVCVGHLPALAHELREPCRDLFRRG